MNLWLIGMMGAGKSTIGRQLSERLGMEWADSDEEVAARTGCSIAHLFGTRGEEAFRDLEQMAIDRLATGSDQVIATGGGAVLRQDNVDAMRLSGYVVWLHATPEVLAERVGAANESRPLLADAQPDVETLRDLSRARHERYVAAAHQRVETDCRLPEDIVDEVVGLWMSSR